MPEATDSKHCHPVKANVPVQGEPVVKPQAQVHLNLFYSTFEGMLGRLGARHPREMAGREEMRWGECKTQQSCVRRGSIQLCEASEGWGAEQELGSAGTHPSRVLGAPPSCSPSMQDPE